MPDDIIEDYQRFKERQATKTTKSKSRNEEVVREKKTREVMERDERREFSTLHVDEIDATFTSVKELLGRLKREYNVGADDPFVISLIEPAYRSLSTRFGDQIRPTVDPKQFGDVRFINDIDKMIAVAYKRRDELSRDDFNAIVDVQLALMDIVSAVERFNKGVNCEL